MVRFSLHHYKDWVVAAPIEAKIFLLLGSVFGLLFIFISSPMQAADEPQHFWRAYEVSELDFIPNRFDNGRYGYNLPNTVITMGEQFLIQQDKKLPPDTSAIKKLLHEKNYGAKRPIYFENSGVYSPVPYAPQAVGIGLARSFKLPVLWLMYAGRIVNLLVWLVLVFIALRTLAAYRWIALVVALLPMSVFQAASLSPDGITNAFIFLTFALFIRFMKNKQIGLKEILLSTGALLILSLTKQVYISLCLMFLFIPRKYFVSSRQRTLSLMLWIGLPVAATLLWFTISQPISKLIPVVFRPGANVNPQDQLTYIVHYPLKYAATILYTLLYKQSTFLTTSLFGRLGWATIILPTYTYLLIAVTLTMAILKEGGSVAARVLSRSRLRLALTTTGVATILAVCTSLYFTFSTVGATQIEGLQGRYFIPVLLLLLPVFVSKGHQLKISEKRFTIFISCSLLVVLMISVAMLLNVNYIHIFRPEYPGPGI